MLSLTPIERRNQIQDADVARFGVLRPEQIRQIQESEYVQAMRHRDEHDIMLLGKTPSVRAGGIGGSARKTTAVKPHHHGALAGLWPDRRCPHVEVQAILGQRTFLQHGGFFGHRGAKYLRRHRAGFRRVLDAAPMDGRFGRQPAVRPSGRCAVGYALEYFHRSVGETPDLTGGRLHDGRRRGALRNRDAHHHRAKRTEGPIVFRQSSCHHASPSIYPKCQYGISGRAPDDRET